MSAVIRPGKICIYQVTNPHKRSDICSKFQRNYRPGKRLAEQRQTGSAYLRTLLSQTEAMNITEGYLWVVLPMNEHVSLRNVSPHRSESRRHRQLLLETLFPAILLLRYIISAA